MCYGTRDMRTGLELLDIGCKVVTECGHIITAREG